MLAPLRRQLERWQQSLKQAALKLEQRVDALRQRRRSGTAGNDEGDALVSPAAASRGASRESGPYVPRAQRQSTPATESHAVGQTPPAPRTREEPPAEPEVEHGPVRLISGQAIVRPFLVLSLLTMAVVGSALAVIFAAYDYRQLFHEQQMLIKARDELQVEWGQLLLEQSAWAANNRVETQAIRRLEMQVPAPGEIEIVRQRDGTD